MISSRKAIVIAAFALLAGSVCQRESTALREEQLSPSDFEKMTAAVRSEERGQLIEDLPVKYHGRKIPEPAQGELFFVYMGGKLLKAVRPEDFTCEPEQAHLRGHHVLESCSLLPYLRSLTKEPITTIELVGQGKKVIYGKLNLEDLETEDLGLISFVNKRGLLRVEVRPKGSFLTEEEIGRDGKELRKERKAQGGGKGGGAMRDRFQTRGLYWIDLHTSEPPKEAREASAKAAEEKAAKEAAAP